MGVLYAKDGKIYSHSYIEIYIPMEYFSAEVAFNKGSSIETLGIVYTRTFTDGVPGDVKIMNIPVIVDFIVYETKYETITVGDQRIDTFVLEYLPDTYIVHQTLPKGREVANKFLESMLSGKLPRTLNYSRLIDIWWKNLEISGISYKVPSKIFEMIIASIYRNPNDPKQRYGQLYGKQANPTGYDYRTDNVRNVVKNLSTFSGMVFEDISLMLTNGINNKVKEIEEPISPLEKIIHY